MIDTTTICDSQRPLCSETGWCWVQSAPCYPPPKKKASGKWSGTLLSWGSHKEYIGELWFTLPSHLHFIVQHIPRWNETYEFRPRMDWNSMVFLKSNINGCICVHKHACAVYRTQAQQYLLNDSQGFSLEVITAASRFNTRSPECLSSRSAVRYLCFAYSCKIFPISTPHPLPSTPFDYVGLGAVDVPLLILFGAFVQSSQFSSHWCIRLCTQWIRKKPPLNSRGNNFHQDKVVNIIQQACTWIWRLQDLQKHFHHVCLRERGSASRRTTPLLSNETIGALHFI